MLLLPINVSSQSTACFEIVDLPDTFHVCKNSLVYFNPYLESVGTITPLDTTWSPSTGLNNPDIINPTATMGTNSQQYILVVEGLTEQNLIQNWDFSLGVSGFTTSYTQGFGPNGLMPEETYTVISNPSLVHPNFASFYDHTTGNSSGSMMVVNGSGVANTLVWLQNISVNPDTWYDFSAWGATCVSQAPALLQFRLNGILLDSPFQLPNSTGEWVPFHSKWYSGTSLNAEISIVDQQTALSGNDFAIDDLKFREICKATDSVYVHVIDLRPEFIYDPVPACTSDWINFTYTYIGGDFPEEFLWDFGDGTTSTELDPGHLFYPKGTYQISLTVKSGDCEERFSLEINTQDFIEPVNADLINDNDLVCINEMINFYSLSHGNDPLEYFWDFGDGNTSEDFEVSHSYDYPGFYTVTHFVTDSYLCSDTVRIEIEVIAPPEFAAVPDHNLCFGEHAVIDLSDIYYNIEWQDGNKDKIRYFYQSGSYSYTIFNGVNCYSIDTFKIIINPEPLKNTFIGSICIGENYDFFGDIYDKPGIYTDTIKSYLGCDSIYYELTLSFTPPMSSSIGSDKNQICVGESISFESLANGASPFSYQWEFGDGNFSTVQNPVYTFYKPGNFVVNLIITDKYLCSDTLFTGISVMSYPSVFPVSDFNLCYGDYALVEIDINDEEIIWNDGSTDSVRNLTITGTYSYTLINSFNCASSDTFNVFFSASPELLNIEKVLCKYEKFNFLNKTYEIPGTYFDTIYTDFGCDSLIYTINISRYISASISSDRSSICIGDTVNFYSFDTGLAPLEFKWMFEDGNFDDFENTSYIFSSPGKYLVYHIVTDNSSCSDTARLDITVNNLPVIKPVYDQFACFDESIELDLNDYFEDIVWNDGSIEKLRNLVIEGIYSYTLIDENACEASDTFLVSKSPDPTSVTIEKKLCKGEIFTFLDKDFGTPGSFRDTIFSLENCDSVYYDISILQYPVFPIKINGELGICVGEKTTIDITSPHQNIFLNGEKTLNKLEISESGLYNIIADDINGCTDTLLFEVEKYPSPGIITEDFIDVPYIKDRPLSVIFDGNIMEYSWKPEIGLDCYICPYPKISTKWEGTYTIKVVNDFGCYVENDLEISYRKLSIYIPNVIYGSAHNPNNEVFLLKTNIDVNYNLMIFDRWGEKLFKAEKLRSNDFSAGWHPGKKYNPGVFVWVIQYEFEGESKTLAGDITLLQ